MSGPPARLPAIQEAHEAGPRGKANRTNPYVKVINAVWNGNGFIKRKLADRYVTEGRGAFVDDDHNQIRLNLSHPKNRAAAARAAEGYTLDRTLSEEEVAHVPVVRPGVALRDALTK
jgi:hypothetical protein